jgi:hypothetical protein
MLLYPGCTLGCIGAFVCFVRTFLFAVFLSNTVIEYRFYIFVRLRQYVMNRPESSPSDVPMRNIPFLARKRILVRNGLTETIR